MSFPEDNKVKKFTGDDADDPDSGIVWDLIAEGDVLPVDPTARYPMLLFKRKDIS